MQQWRLELMIVASVARLQPRRHDGYDGHDVPAWCANAPENLDRRRSRRGVVASFPHAATTTCRTGSHDDATHTTNTSSETVRLLSRCSCMLPRQRRADTHRRC